MSWHYLYLVFMVHGLVGCGCMALLGLAALAKHLLVLNRRGLLGCLQLVRLLHDKLVQTFIVGYISMSRSSHIMIVIIMPSTFLLRLLGSTIHYGLLLL